MARNNISRGSRSKRIDELNAMAPMRAGRARWRIENETFNT